MVNGFFPGVLNPSTTVAGCIDVYENAWPNPQYHIESIENEIDKHDSEIYWERAATVGSGPYQNIRNNRMLRISELSMIENNVATQNIHNQFKMLLYAATPGYCLKYGINEQFYHEDYWLLKYQKDQNYGQHYDSNTQLGRCVSAIVYLNNNYVGGEIEFVNFKIKIQPEPGMLILFPSNYAYSHIAHPVNSGYKYCLVTWIRDRPF